MSILQVLALAAPLTLMGRLLLSVGLLIATLTGCATRYIEFKGECVIQQWQLLSVTMRVRQICDLPPPTMLEEQVRDRDAMDVNPFPDLFDLKNPADTSDPNLLEKRLEKPYEAKPYEDWHLEDEWFPDRDKDSD